jgi:hypothetical protein
MKRDTNGWVFDINIANNLAYFMDISKAI